MSPLIEKKIRFTAAAVAAGTTPKTLRNWLERGLASDPDGHEGGWREFSFIDVLVLTLVRLLSDYGLPISSAADIAGKVIHKVAAPLTLYRNAPPEALVALFEGHMLTVWKASEAWRFELRTPSAFLITSDTDFKTSVEVPLRAEFEDVLKRLEDWN